MKEFISLKDKQVSAEEFEKYSNKNLKLYLGMNSSQIESFIYRKQLEIDTFLETQFFKRPSSIYWQINDFQKKHYKIGVMEQILYELRNGEISSDSGYNGEIGAVIHADYLNYVTLSKAAQRHFVLAGMLSRKILGRNMFDFGGYYD